MYHGPLPIEVRCRLRTLVSSPSLGMMKNEPGVMRPSSGMTTALGSLSLITTVLASGAVTDAIGACGLTSVQKSARWLLIDLWRWKLATTSLASTARPLTGATGWKAALALTFAVIVSLSGDSSHDSTMSPSTSPVELDM